MLRRQLQSPWIPPAGFIHLLLTALQVIQQRAIGVGELAAKMLAGLEQTRGSPAVKGPFADVKTGRCFPLHSPRSGGSHGFEWLGKDQKPNCGFLRLALAIKGTSLAIPTRQRLPMPAIDIPSQGQTGRFERVLSGTSKPNP